MIHNSPGRLRRFAVQLRGRLGKIRFRKKLVLSYLVLILIPMLSLGIFAYTMSDALLNQQFESILSANAKQLASFLGNRLDKNNEFIRFTAFSPYLMEDFNGNPKDWYVIGRKISNYFEPVAWYNMSMNADFSELHIYFEYLDTSIGTFISPAAEVADTAWYRRICDTAGTEWFFEDGELYAVRRIWNAPIDLLLGAVQVKMNMESIAESLVAAQQNEYGIILTDAQGTILFATSLDGETDEAALHLFLANASGNVRVADKEYYVTAQPVPDYDWTLHTYVAIDAFTNQRGHIFYIVALLIGACAAILLGLIHVFSTTMVKRLEMLNDRMRKITGVTGKDIIPVQLQDEVGMLDESFGELIGQIYKSKLIQKEGELKALQAQISPHLLYNSLSLINCKALEIDNTEISHIAGFIATYYRTCLNKGQPLISIRDELNNIESYINIQLVMHDQMFDVVYDIDPRVLAFHTINFTLQPLVENAILHGLDENENVRGTLRVSAAVVNESEIWFTVEDNGVGMDAETLESIFESDTTGYGIKNSNQRIKLYFGNDYGIHLSSKPGNGTTAVLRIPMQ